MPSQSRYLQNLVTSTDWTEEAGSSAIGAPDDTCAYNTKGGGSGTYNFLGNLFSIPGGYSIIGIEAVNRRACSDSDDTYSVELYDSGSVWRSKNGTNYNDTCANATDETLGSSGDVWGGTWTAAHINSTSFQVRLTNIGAAKAGTFYFDCVQIIVHYAIVQSILQTFSIGTTLDYTSTLTLSVLNPLNIGERGYVDIAKTITGITFSFLHFFSTDWEEEGLTKSILQAIALTDNSYKNISKYFAEIPSLTELISKNVFQVRETVLNMFDAPFSYNLYAALTKSIFQAVSYSDFLGPLNPFKYLFQSVGLSDKRSSYLSKPRFSTLSLIDMTYNLIGMFQEEALSLPFTLSKSITTLVDQGITIQDFIETWTGVIRILESIDLDQYQILRWTQRWSAESIQSYNLMTLKVNKWMIDTLNLMDYMFLKIILLIYQSISLPSFLDYISTWARYPFQAIDILSFWSYAITGLIQKLMDVEAINLAQFLDYISNFKRTIPQGVSVTEYLVKLTGKYLPIEPISLIHFLDTVLAEWLSELRFEAMSLIDTISKAPSKVMEQVFNIQKILSFSVFKELEQPIQIFDYIASKYSKRFYEALQSLDIATLKASKWLIATLNLLDFLLLKTSIDLYQSINLQIFLDYISDWKRYLFQAIDIIGYWSYQVTGFIQQAIDQSITLTHFLDYISNFKRVIELDITLLGYISKFLSRPFPIETLTLTPLIDTLLAEWLTELRFESISLVSYFSTFPKLLKLEASGFLDYLLLKTGLNRYQTISILEFLDYISNWKRYPSIALSLWSDVIPQLSGFLFKKIDQAIGLLHYLETQTDFHYPFIQSINLQELRSSLYAKSIETSLTLISFMSQALRTIYYQSLDITDLFSLASSKLIEESLTIVLETSKKITKYTETLLNIIDFLIVPLEGLFLIEAITLAHFLSKFIVYYQDLSDILTTGNYLEMTWDAIRPGLGITLIDQYVGLSYLLWQSFLDIFSTGNYLEFVWDIIEPGIGINLIDEYVALSKLYWELLSESVALSLYVSYISSFMRTISEDLAFSPFLAFVQGFYRIFLESPAISDLLNTFWSGLLGLVEHFDVPDIFAYIFITSIKFAESLAFIDYIEKLIPLIVKEVVLYLQDLTATVFLKDLTGVVYMKGQETYLYFKRLFHTVIGKLRGWTGFHY